MESSNRKSGKFEKSKRSSLRSHISFRVKINEIFFVSHCSPINLFEGRKSALLPGSLLKQKIKLEFSELLEQKITLNGSKLCWMAKGRLAGVPVLSPVTLQEVTLPASCIPVPSPPWAADCRVLAASPRHFSGISSTSLLHLSLFSLPSLEQLQHGL